MLLLFLSFIITFVLSMIILGFALKNNYKNKGFATYPDECKTAANTYCSSEITRRRRRRCEREYLQSTCSDRANYKGGIAAVVAVHIIASIIIGVSIIIIVRVSNSLFSTNVIPYY